MTESEGEHQKQLREAVERGDAEQAAHTAREMGAGEAAGVLSLAPPAASAGVLLRLLPSEAADILEDLPDDIAAATVSEMPTAEAATIVGEMLTDEETDLLQHLPGERASQILEHFDEPAAEQARELLIYEEDTAGGMMRIEHIAIPRGRTAAQVVRILREGAEEFADYRASYLYVVDDEGRLDGVLSLRDLILCDAAQPVSTIKRTDVVSVSADTPARELVEVFRRTHYLAIPVVDADGRLLGVVLQEAAMRYAEEDAEETLLRVTGIAGGDEFRVMPLRQRSMRRLSWLSLNVLLNVLAASVIALYESTLQSVIALAVFLPIISDMSGCSGNQAVAVSIRELSLGRVEPGRVLWVVGKELSVGLVNGLALGALLALIAWLWKGSVALGVIVGGALWINTLVAVMVGGSVPLLLRRFGRDPAIAAGPILTTLTDLCGFFVVLALATRFLYLLT